MINIPKTHKNKNRFTANVGDFLGYPNYLGSYKESFDVLIKEVLERKSHVDYLSYPILFLARHCIELGLKTNIDYFSKYSNKRDCLNSKHNLEILFACFKTHIEGTFENFKTNYKFTIEKEDKVAFYKRYNEIEKLNSLFHEIDKFSFAFRYPFDIEDKAKTNFDKGYKIDILEVNELLERAMELFTLTANLFSKYTDYVDRLENNSDSLQTL